MAYDPADLKLPDWLLRILDALIRWRIPLNARWRLSMTRPGVIFVTAVIGVWAAAFYSGNNLLYVCGAVLFSLWAAALWRGAALLRRFPALDSLPIAEAGTPLVFRRRIPCKAESAAVVELHWRNEAGEWALTGRYEGDGLLLGGRIRMRKRGIFALHQLRLRSEAPLGLFRLERLTDIAGELVVLPKAVPWRMPDAGASGDAGREHGDEWRDLRAYTPGDTLSKVHWRKAAAQGEDTRGWMVKRFGAQAESVSVDILRVDLSLPRHAEAQAFEEMLGKAWFWLQAHRHRPGRLWLGQNMYETVSDEGYHAAVRALASCQAGDTAPAEAEGVLLSVAGVSY